MASSVPRGGNLVATEQGIREATLPLRKTWHIPVPPRGRWYVRHSRDRFWVVAVFDDGRRRPRDVSRKRPTRAGRLANLPSMAAPLPAELRLDVEAAKTAVRQLENVRQQMESARAEAFKLGKATPTAQDAVSLDAFALLAQRADGGPGSFTAAMDAGLDHVQSLIDEMRANIDRQRDLDEAAAAGFADHA